jgi:hypothetical protein
VQVLESLQLESFNESPNAQPLYIPTSNYLLERNLDYPEPVRIDYKEAVQKGFALICRLESQGEFPPSPYTTLEDLYQSGWDFEIPQGHQGLDNFFGVLQPAFNELGIEHNPLDDEEVRWTHARASLNMGGQEAPVCFHRLY